MIIFTAKLNKKKAIASVLITGLLLCLLVNCVSAAKNTAYKGDEAMERMSVQTLKTVKTDEQRTEYLNSLGLRCGQLIESRQIEIPSEFDDAYEKYNKIQTDSGFDLEKYKGKQATVFSYPVENYPTGEQNVRANLIVVKGKLVGGDICSSKLDGFMHGLRKCGEE